MRVASADEAVLPAARAWFAGDIWHAVYGADSPGFNPPAHSGSYYCAPKRLSEADLRGSYRFTPQMKVYLYFKVFYERGATRDLKFTRALRCFKKRGTTRDLKFTRALRCVYERGRYP